LKIYDEFIYHSEKSKAHELNNWLRSRFLNKKTLNQAKELINEINETVKNFNFDLRDPSAKKLVDIIKIRMM
jgi:HrpA-like RNA helicase